MAFLAEYILKKVSLLTYRTLFIEKRTPFSQKNMKFSFGTNFVPTGYEVNSYTSNQWESPKGAPQMKNILSPVATNLLPSLVTTGKPQKVPLFTKK